MTVTTLKVCEDLLQVLSKFKACINELADDYGLTQVQTHALYVLHQRHSIAMGQVAGELHCDASNVTGIVDRLVAQKLATRTEDPHDRRTKRLELTPKGKQVIETFFDRLPEQLGFGVLSTEDQTALHHILQKLLV